MAHRRTLTLLVPVLVTLVAAAPAAIAPHLYRNGSLGCTPASGDLGALPALGTGDLAGDLGYAGSGSVVYLMHNTFLDVQTGTPLTIIDAGEKVTFRWASAHCHSATSGTFNAPTTDFDTGYHYPTAEPESPCTPQPVYGFLACPVPDVSSTLSSTITFTTPGVYSYFCVHHYNIGMNALVVVQ